MIAGYAAFVPGLAIVYFHKDGTSDDLMSAVDHEVEAADVSEGSPAALGIRPIEELESIGKTFDELRL